MNEAIFARDTLVQVTSYSPWWGRKGTIRAVDLIDTQGSSLVAFYLIALQNEPRTEWWLDQMPSPRSSDAQIRGGG